MAKSVTALKDILRREERLVIKIKDTVAVMAHKESKATLRGFLKNKRAEVREYKKIIKMSEKCPAIKKPAGKCAPAKAKKSTGRCKKPAKK
ncbi:MAG: hypothetical protein ACE5EZ_02335 [Thermodesulfobacteriota bacterium]